MTEPTSQEEPQESKGERWVSGKEWIACSLIAALSSLPALRFGGLALVEVFIGRLAAVVIIWVIVRGAYRWIAEKRTVE